MNEEDRIKDLETRLRQSEARLALYESECMSEWTMERLADLYYHQEGAGLIDFIVDHVLCLFNDRLGKHGWKPYESDGSLEEALEYNVCSLLVDAGVLDEEDHGITHLKVAAIREEMRAALEIHNGKKAPVQGYPQGIPWDMHMEAYAAYVKRYGEQKAMIEGWCRGGFGTSELDMFIPGWRDELKRRHESSREAALKEEAAKLREDFAKKYEHEVNKAYRLACAVEDMHKENERLKQFETAYHKANGYNDTSENLDDWIRNLVPEITLCQLSERTVIQQVQDLHRDREELTTLRARVAKLEGAIARLTDPKRWVLEDAEWRFIPDIDHPIPLYNPMDVAEGLLTPPPPSQQEEKPLPSVIGRTVATSLGQFVRGCRVHIAKLQAQPNYDSALLNTLCEAIRLAREYSDSMNDGLPTTEEEGSR